MFNIVEGKMDNIRNEIGGRIREARKKSGVKNLRDAAGIFGVSEGTWGNWERGDAFPAPEELIKIADRFQVSFDYLFTGQGDPRPPSATDKMLEAAVRGHSGEWNRLDNPASDFEVRILGMLRRLPQDTRQRFLDLITSAYYDEMEKRL
jgi:transcriptional regulator with XRE-family HTH domain